MCCTVVCWVAWYKWAHASWIGLSNSIGIVHFIDRQTQWQPWCWWYIPVCVSKGTIHNSKRQIIYRTENKKCQTYIGRKLGLGLLRNSTARLWYSKSRKMSICDFLANTIDCSCSCCCFQKLIFISVSHFGVSTDWSSEKKLYIPCGRRPVTLETVSRTKFSLFEKMRRKQLC